MRAVLRSSAAWLGCVSEDAWLSTFASPESVRELLSYEYCGGSGKISKGPLVIGKASVGAIKLEIGKNYTRKVLYLVG
jgi:hypothetical protein